jgi:hypothetical protein
MDGLKDIRFFFEQFFGAHMAVGTYMYGNLKDFTANAHKTYKAINIEYQNTVVAGKIDRHVFNVLIADRMDDAIPQTQHDAHADCLQVYADLQSGLNEQGNMFTATQATPFIQADGDIQAGVIGGIIINTGRISDFCFTPLNP